MRSTKPSSSFCFPDVNLSWAMELEIKECRICSNLFCRSSWPACMQENNLDTTVASIISIVKGSVSPRAIITCKISIAKVWVTMLKDSMVPFNVGFGSDRTYLWTVHVSAIKSNTRIKSTEGEALWAHQDSWDLTSACHLCHWWMTRSDDTRVQLTGFNSVN